MQFRQVKPFLEFVIYGRQIGSEKICLEICRNEGECETLNLEVQVGIFPKLGPNAPTAYLQNPQIPVNVDRGNVPKTKDDQVRQMLRMQNLRTRIGVDHDTLGPMPFQQLFEEPDTALFRYHPTAMATGDRSYLTVKPGFSAFSKEKAIFLGMLAGLLLLLGWWLRYRRRKVMLAYTDRQGPYHWLMRIPGKPRLSLDHHFSRALTAFKARDAYFSNQLDVAETVGSTIRKGGSIQLAFQEIHKQQQFLLLVDQSCTHLHRHKTFELLIDELIREEAPIKRYYFSGDPRVCWEQSANQVQSLATLSHRYGSSALLIYSDGQRMLDYRSGKLAAWTKIFSRWRQRLLLLPEWNTSLGRYEQQMSESFRIVPANTQGLAEAVGVLEALNIYKHREFRRSFSATATSFLLPESLDQEQLFVLLCSYLLTYDAEQREDDSLLRWIAACAIPAAPFWEWTLLVGRELEAMEARPICTLANLETLNRLPWLAQNQIPEHYRTALVEWLEQHYPVFLLRMRQRWAEVLTLEENLPPVDSLAWNDHHVALIINRLFQPDMEQQERQRLEQELEQLLHGQQVQDAMIIKYVRDKSFGLDHRLFKRFRHLFVKQEKVVSRWRDWIWQVPILILVAVVNLWTYYLQPVTSYQLPGRVDAVTYSSDGQNVLVASNDRGVRYLSRFTGTDTWEQTVRAAGRPLVGVATDAENNYVFTVSQDHQILLLNDSMEYLGGFGFENSLITDVDFHPTNPSQVLISFFGKRGDTYRAEFWDFTIPERLAVYPHQNSVYQAKFGPDGQYVFTGSQDHTAVLWSIEGGKLTELQHPDEVNRVSIDLSQRWLLTGSKDNRVRLWTWDGQAVESFDVAHDDNITALALSNSGAYLASGSRDSDLRLYTIPDGALVRDFNGHRLEIRSLTFSPDESILVSGDTGGILKFWGLD